MDLYRLFPGVQVVTKQVLKFILNSVIISAMGRFRFRFCVKIKLGIRTSLMFSFWFQIVIKLSIRTKDQEFGLSLRLAFGPKPWWSLDFGYWLSLRFCLIIIMILGSTTLASQRVAICK